MEKEVNVADALSLAMAVHNNGGRVMVQVERLSGIPAYPQAVVIPGALVDDIWLSPDQAQTNLPDESPITQASYGHHSSNWMKCVSKI